MDRLLQVKKNSENEIIRFEQLAIDLSNLSTTTIKKPKIQETSTYELLRCFNNTAHFRNLCVGDSKKRNYTSS